MTCASQFCLGSISNKFDYVQLEEVSIKERIYDFLVDLNTIDKSDILNIHKYLIWKNEIKCLDLVNNSLFSGLFATEFISLNNQPCMTRPSHFDLNPDVLHQGLHLPSVYGQFRKM